MTSDQRNTLKYASESIPNRLLLSVVSKLRLLRNKTTTQRNGGSFGEISAEMEARTSKLTDILVSSLPRIVNISSRTNLPYVNLV